MAKCFVAMPVSTPEVWVERYSDREHFKHVLDHLFIPALTLANYEVVPPTAAGSDLIHAEIIKNLEECDLVLCDISTLNPNVFFELGIRTSLDRPVALVRDNLTPQIPFDTVSINTHTYDSSLQPWILESQISSLATHITDVAEKSGARNSLWRYFGLTQRATPAEIADPTQAKLDLLIAEVSRLAPTTLKMNLTDYSIEELAFAQALKQQAVIDQILNEREGLSPATPRRRADIPSRIKNMTFSNIPSSDLERITKEKVRTEDIPAKYDAFARDVKRALMKVHSRAWLEYYPVEDVIIIGSSGAITSVQAEDVAELAEASSIKYALRVFVYE